MTENGLASDFIKQRLKYETELEKRIQELEEELRKERDLARSNPDNEELYLCEDLLNIMIPYILFEYDANPSYTDTTGGGYKISLTESIPLPDNCVQEMIRRIKKYQEDHNIEIHIH